LNLLNPNPTASLLSIFIELPDTENPSILEVCLPTYDLPPFVVLGLF